MTMDQAFWYGFDVVAKYGFLVVVSAVTVWVVAVTFGRILKRVADAELAVSNGCRGCGATGHEPCALDCAERTWT